MTRVDLLSDSRSTKTLESQHTVTLRRGGELFHTANSVLGNDDSPLNAR